MKKLFLGFAIVSSLNAVAQGNLEGAEEKLDGAYEKVTLEERNIIQYDHIREADVTWSKRIWRNIDCREKVNLPFVHPKFGFVKVVHDAAVRGELKVYATTPKGEEWKESISNDDVAKIGARRDTLTRFNIETEQEETYVAETEFNPEDVKKLRLKEDWFFDKETSTMIVRIIGIALIRERKSETGDLLGDELMYWIYYPDARSILAQSQVYNFKNDASTMSWEDMFEIRYFSSYIIKESNPYDRRIQDYAITGLDQMYESDRIQNDVRNFESDLWEY
ncbi:MAG: gliding motility protein GldN [Chitinophagales bacterium]|jgi:gliding motility associated protien GldN|nr:gliding motility protein GldN [Chitinophagales bacterium]